MKQVLAAIALLPLFFSCSTPGPAPEFEEFPETGFFAAEIPGTEDTDGAGKAPPPPEEAAPEDAPPEAAVPEENNPREDLSSGDTLPPEEPEPLGVDLPEPEPPPVPEAEKPFVEPSPEAVASLEYPEPEPPFFPEPPPPPLPPPPPIPPPPVSPPPPPPPPAPPVQEPAAPEPPVQPPPQEPSVSPAPPPPAAKPEAPSVPPEPPAALRPAEPAPRRPGTRPAPPPPVEGPAPPGPAQAAPPQAETRPPAPAPRPPAPPPFVVENDPPASGREDEITYSRVVRVPLGSTLEVPFRGTGWVFLGEAGSKRGLSYVSRRIEPEGQNFIFLAEETGEYELRFYKQDFIRDYILNDHVRVIVEDGLGENSFFYTPPGTGLGDAGNSVVAEPRWPLSAAGPAALPEDPGAVGTERPESGGGAGPAVNGANTAAPLGTGAGPRGPEEGANTAAETGAVPAQRPGQGSAGTEKEDVEPSALVRRAREEQEGGHIPEALALLDRFRERFPLGSDEAWWLYGQLLEAPGPNRDIRRALEFYRRLVNEYPQSKRCEDAKKRIAYLERFYFNIR